MTLTNRAIIAAGIVGGVATAIGSMFFAGPERVVQRATGVGDRSPTVEEQIGAAIRRGDFRLAVDLAQQLMETGRGWMSRTALLACTHVFAGRDAEAIALMRERLGPDGSETALAFARGETPSGDQRLDFLEGTWRVWGEGGSFLATLRGVSEGRGFVEVWRSRDGVELCVVYMFEAGRSMWHRIAATGSGRVFAYRGAANDGDAEFVLWRDGGRESNRERRLVFERLAEGPGFVRRIEVLNEGQWRFESAILYRPWVPLLGAEFTDERFAEPVY